LRALPRPNAFLPLLPQFAWSGRRYADLGEDMSHKAEFAISAYGVVDN